MVEYLHNNMFWITPVICIVLTIIIKISAKPEFVTLGFVDYLDFGFDLSISSIIILVSEIISGTKNETGIWLLLAAFVLILITSIIVQRLGWKKSTHQLRFIGAIIPDVVGVFLLVIASLYTGGVIV